MGKRGGGFGKGVGAPKRLGRPQSPCGRDLPDADGGDKVREKAMTHLARFHEKNENVGKDMLDVDREVDGRCGEDGHRGGGERG